MGWKFLWFQEIVDFLQLPWNSEHPNFFANQEQTQTATSKLVPGRKFAIRLQAEYSKEFQVLVLRSTIPKKNSIIENKFSKKTIC